MTWEMIDEVINLTFTDFVGSEPFLYSTQGANKICINHAIKIGTWKPFHSGIILL